MRCPTAAWRLRAVVPLIGITLTTGCAALQANLPTGRLDAVVQSDRYVESPTVAQVYVMRGANTVSPSVQMRLNPGDSIVTAAGTRVILEFTAGYRVTLDGGTTLAIEGGAGGASSGGSGGAGANEARGEFSVTPIRPQVPAERRRPAQPLMDAPGSVASRISLPFETADGHRDPRTGVPDESSAAPNGVIALFLRIGRAFVERVRGTPDSLSITTPSRVVLHDAGTQFLVAVAPGGTTSLTVAEGAVRIESIDPANAWPAVIRTALQQGEYVRGVRPSPMPTLTQRDVVDRVSWAREARLRSRVVVPKLDSMSRDQAAAVLQRVGLKLLPVTFHETSSDVAPERIVRTTPAAGDSVAPGSFVTLYLAKAPKGGNTIERTPQTQQGCVVPDLVGKMKTDADVLLRRAGLLARATANGGDIDVVTAQKQAKGSSVACGSVVEYSYGKSSIR